MAYLVNEFFLFMGQPIILINLSNSEAMMSITICPKKYNTNSLLREAS